MSCDLIYKMMWKQRYSDFYVKMIIGIIQKLVGTNSQINGHYSSMEGYTIGNIWGSIQCLRVYVYLVIAI